MPPDTKDIISNKVSEHKSVSYTTTLNVAPFPYLPDPWNNNNNQLLQFIKDEFQAAYPNVELVLRAMNSSEDFYNITILGDFLAPDGSQYDVVEVDTVLLGDLIAANLIYPQTYPIVPSQIPADWHPAAAKAVQVNQAIYGFPHLMCAFFLFTHGYPNDQSVFQTLDDLQRYINYPYHVPGVPDYIPGTYRLVGNLDSSWDLSAIWIDSFRDLYYPPYYTEAEALHGWEHLSFADMRKFANLCEHPTGNNDCLNGVFRDNFDDPVLLFGNYSARALFGYSERLFYILKLGLPYNYFDVKAQPLPFGYATTKNPVFFTDAYVFRRNMSSDKLVAAKAFVNFMATPRMQTAVVGNEIFAPHFSLRYLLPMSQSAFNEPLLKGNRFYQDYFRNLSGDPFPNTGFLNGRKTLSPALRNYITGG